MTKEEYLDWLTGKKPEYSDKFRELDASERDKLCQEIEKDLSFNNVIPSLDSNILNKLLDEIENITLARALKLATEETKKIIFSNLSNKKLLEIEELYDYIGPQIFSEIINNQEYILKRINENK